jgi:hypothetical protein
MAQEQIQNCIEQIVTWILDGNSLSDIKEACLDTFNIDCDFELYLKQALVLIDQRAESSGGKNWHLEARKELFKKTLSFNDYKTCLAILKDLASLEGLYPSKSSNLPKNKINLSSNIPLGTDLLEDIQ